MNRYLLIVFLVLFSLSSWCQRRVMTVAQDGSGDFRRVQEAFSSIPSPNKELITIRIKKGVYKEKLLLDSTQHHITLIGENAQTTVLTFDDYNGKISPSGTPFRTFDSSSFTIKPNDFRAENLTFANSSGPVGQAVAVFIPGDRAVFINCRFLGFQDTLYVGMPGQYGRQYYQNCYIEGTIDFIFGSATAVFDRCTIHSKQNGPYVTAASTPEGKPYGLVFLHCELTGEDPAGTVYLGRPWRDYAKTAFLSCKLGKHIRAEGWHDWDKPQAQQTVVYAEYASKGPGVNPKRRVAWARQLSKAEAEAYRIQTILSGEDHWNPLTTAKR